MKSNYKLKLISALVVLGVSVVNAKALQPTLTPTTITAENSDEWVMVQNENGIKTFFLQTKKNGESSLKIKFVNTTNALISFHWSLDKKANPFFTDVSNSIEPLSFIEIDETTMMVPLNNGESIKDFTITTNLK